MAQTTEYISALERTRENSRKSSATKIMSIVLLPKLCIKSMTVELEIYKMIKVKRGGSRPFGRKFFPDVKKITSELQDKDGKIIEGVGILYGIEEVKFVGFPIAYVKSLEVKI